MQKEKIREKFVAVLKEEFKGKGLSFSIGEETAASVAIATCFVPKLSIKSGWCLCFSSSSSPFVPPAPLQEGRLASMCSQMAGIRDSASASLRRTTTKPFTSLEIRPNL